MPTADPTSSLTTAAALLSATGFETILIATVAALAAALIVRRTPWGPLTGLLRLVAGVLAFAATVSYFAATADRERAAQMQALAAREAALTASAVAPGSPLACLDDMSGETVGDACEKAIFARPETVAAAVAYVDARLTLTADMVRLAASGDAGLTSRLAALRHSLALDRYGIAAHVLAERDGCTADSCAAFAWIGDANVLRTNLRGRAFNAYLGRYAASWGPAKPAAPAGAPQAEAAPAEPAKAGTNFAGRYDFPSAASIPPVSIMNPEPPRPPGEATAATSTAAPPTAQAATPPMPPRRPVARPVPITPPAASTGRAAAPQQPVTATPDPQ